MREREHREDKKKVETKLPEGLFHQAMVTSLDPRELWMWKDSCVEPQRRLVMFISLFLTRLSAHIKMCVCVCVCPWTLVCFLGRWRVCVFGQNIIISLNLYMSAACKDTMETKSVCVVNCRSGRLIRNLLFVVGGLVVTSGLGFSPPSLFSLLPSSLPPHLSSPVFIYSFPNLAATFLG